MPKGARGQCQSIHHSIACSATDFCFSPRETLVFYYVMFAEHKKQMCINLKLKSGRRVHMCFIIF